MFMKRTLLTAALLIVGAALIFFAVQATKKTGKNETQAVQPAAETAELKIWTLQEETEITQQMCALFAEKHPDYNLMFTYAVMGNADSIDALKKDADVAADVFMFPSGGIPELVEAGLIYPITMNTDVLQERYGEAAIKSCSYKGRLYGIPITSNSWFMYYNKSMYTPEEVTSLEKMMQKDLGKNVKNFSCAIANSWYMEAFFYALGGTLYGVNGDDPSQCSWNDADGFRAGEYLIDLAANPRYVEDADGLANALIAEGKLGALCSGTWSAKTLKEALGENYAAVKLPVITVGGNEYQLRNFVDFRATGVKSGTKYPKIAMELAQWLGSEECQLMRFKENYTPPTVKALAVNPIVLESPEAAALADQTNYAVPQPTTSKLADYWTPAAAFGSGIVNGKITRSNLQENLDAMVKGFTDSLSQ